jgi:predicted RNase H-like nuclease
LLACRDYETALRRKREIDGVGLSKQAFFLLPKMAEVDAAVAPRRQRVVVEAHPELAFARLAGEPLRFPKRTAEGQRVRAHLLARAIGSAPRSRHRGVGRDDVLDAVALTVTARRLAEGDAERLGDGTRDDRGLRMEIAW